MPSPHALKAVALCIWVDGLCMRAAPGHFRLHVEAAVARSPADAVLRESEDEELLGDTERLDRAIIALHPIIAHHAAAGFFFFLFFLEEILHST